MKFLCLVALVLGVCVFVSGTEEIKSREDHKKTSKVKEFTDAISSRVKSIHRAAGHFESRFYSKTSQTIAKANSYRHAHIPNHQRSRHIMFPSGHIDTQTAPVFHNDEHYKILRRGHSPDALYEYYVSLKRVDFKHLEEIEKDMGWEEGTTKKRMNNYVPHNTLLFVGTEEEAHKLAEHDRVYWVGARDPLHKLSTPLQDRNAQHEHKDLSNEQRGYDPLIVRLHFHSGVTEVNQVDNIFRDVQSLLDFNGIKAELTYEDIKEGDENEWLIYSTSKTEKEAKRVALLVASEPSLHYVDLKPVFISHNDLANAFIENGQILEKSLRDDDDDYIFDREESSIGFLTGLDQRDDPYLIGVADSGLDWDNCFFEDRNEDVRFDRDMDDHRKIQYYDTELGDEKDNAAHGTHLAGTVCGKEDRRGSVDFFLPEGTFDGLVPEAKLVVVDVGSDEIALNIPADVARVFSKSFNKGARINVYAWGSAADQIAYNDLDFRTDTFARENPSFMAFFATGNRQYFRFPRKIDSPAAAKSGVAVGSTLGFHEATTRPYGRKGDEFENLYNFFHSQICENFNSWWLDPAFCGSFELPTPCTEFKNSTICPNFQSAEDCCKFAYFIPICCEGHFNENINTSASESYINEWVLDGQTNAGPLYDTRHGVDIVTPGWTISARSDQDTDTKNCGFDGILSMNGTSMSTAVAAGAAQKIVQYIESSYYPYGNPLVNPTGWRPSAILIKALLFTASVPMRSYNGNQRQYILDATNDQVPNRRQGFGAPVLDRILHVEDDTELVWPFISRFIEIGHTDDLSPVDNNHIFLDRNGRWRGCFRTDIQADIITVTMVWDDGPGTKGAALALRNNLDMIVHDYQGRQTFTSAVDNTFDDVNPYEQVHFTPSPFSSLRQVPVGQDDCVPGHPTACQFQQYTLSIIGRSMVDNPEDVPIAIVIHAARLVNGVEFPIPVIELGQTGDDFEGVPLFCDVGDIVCPHNCGGYGECNSDGYCECFVGYSGLDCSLSLCAEGCNGNGVCDGETGTCSCSLDYIGTYCEVFDEGGEAPVIYLDTECNCTCNGVDTGAVIGIAIAVFFLGLIIGLCLGAYFGIKWIIARKRRKVAELQQRLEMKKKGGFEGNAGAADSPM